MSLQKPQTLSIDLHRHLIREARYVPSPNQDDRPDESDLALIVIHGISLPPGKFGGQGVEQLFTNQLDPSEDLYFAEIAGLKVSSHLYIQRSGALTQFVPFNQRAWHAGESCFEGRDACNDFSIGIELEGTDTTPYTASQYHTLREVIKVLLATYPSLSAQAILGHSDIAPQRKTDPGIAFMWQVIDSLKAEIKLSNR
ncbi:MAG: 1,6-anhydro-N-acetylmuramyl-L-alanine amidase AmpD [Piscirickettsiaceae bacterium CG_4_9_14_3_um_filter_43_564]|nr:1,6-anhydro-N-acetylmuramyl-L-alanine amidase AmpD [Thiomicrospira sp.]OIP94716.1 MAG: N-acetylmuramoyl-L-alanine amidase [Thiomicrospira sp. CG2_30_44_34]PIQ03208.1 MAG: 1,6-anhydro-N-acetylmuramyl-L-alanine amidase AmpD [Piscirickettsiaceae bacterium CG18_big_fil_WC_8_21_14_2_50_44_103]PIU39483.1 MAG: 1,6-anhydro-N-acetylmuramyl-L-alanine amidase AmpD [Piscirickettsiaceae bacterium CG07_land_8_20_14_0_80_44_28]PIW58570.1 MAG: 1,6-anhydro-N-acetylmuramyl-L-alanine amidase AmpD [Piscirickett